MRELYELMKKKGKKDMEPMYKDAKMSMLKELQKVMNNELGEEVKGLKKVTVAAKDEEGLKEGLDKAEEMIEEKEAEKDMHEEMPEEMSKDMKKEEMMKEAHEDMSLEDIDEMIKMLEEKKKALSMKE